MEVGVGMGLWMAAVVVARVVDCCVVFTIATILFLLWKP